MKEGQNKRHFLNNPEEGEELEKLRMKNREQTRIFTTLRIENSRMENEEKEESCKASGAQSCNASIAELGAGESCNASIAEYCYICKRYLLFRFSSNTKRCINCHATIFTDDEIKDIDFVSKLKQFNNVSRGLFLRGVSEEEGIGALDFLCDKFFVAIYGLNKYGKLGGLKGRWKKSSKERVEKSICKWLREYVGKVGWGYSLGLELELLNFIFIKPLLTIEQLEEIETVFKDYLKFLHNKELNIRLDYKLFLFEAVKYLNYDIVIFPPRGGDEERRSKLNKLWKEFLESKFMKDTADYLMWEEEIFKKAESMIGLQRGCGVNHSRPTFSPFINGTKK